MNLHCTPIAVNDPYKIDVKGPINSDALLRAGIIDSAQLPSSKALDGFLYTATFTNLSKESISVYAMEGNTIYPKYKYLKESMLPEDFQDIQEGVPIEFMEQMIIAPSNSRTFVFYLNIINNAKFISFSFTVELSGGNRKMIEIKKVYSNENSVLNEI